jgi:hypothetical protein
MNRVTFLVALLALVFVPLPAFGWAPGTHLYYAKELLHFAHLLPEAVRQILATYRTDFLYGCMAADITLGKAYVEYIYNCHNFDVGIGLLDHAKTPAETAFVYGYLSHLACDTVAHNYFVPYQNVRHFEHATFRHAYWEVRLDERFGDRVWHEMQEIIDNKRNHSHDRLLDGALMDTIFSFRTNKILFSSMLAIQRLKKWQQFVKTVNRKSQHQFELEHLDEYNRLAVCAMIRLLSDWKDSPVYRVDPTGAKTMEEAANVRQTLKGLKKSGELTQEMVDEECRRFRAHVIGRHFKDYPINDPSFQPSLDLAI